MVPNEGKAGGVFRRGAKREVSKATKPYGEALITASIWPGIVFDRSDMENRDARRTAVRVT